MKNYNDLATAYKEFQAERAKALQGHYGTSEGVMKAWDTRGRGRGEEEKREREPKKTKAAETGDSIYQRKINVKQVSAKDFVAVRDTMPPALSAFITPYTAEQYEKEGANLYLEASGKGGFGIRGDELISVFSVPGAHVGKELIDSAINLGAKKLDCIGKKLLRLYASKGFKVTKIEKWDDKYKPEKWDTKSFGKPDIYYMVRREEKKQWQ